MDEMTYMERMWERGQEHLGAGRYGAAVRELEAAEGAAWRTRDAVALSRVYLPLLEARRLRRYQAAEGVVVICDPAMGPREVQHTVRGFLHDRALAAGTVLLGCTGGAAGVAAAQRMAGSVKYEARRSGRALAALLLIAHGNYVRLATAADATFAAGLAVRWSGEAGEMIGASTEPALVVPLPVAGRYAAGTMHGLARESLIVAWEALALRWQHRHPLVHAAGGAEGAGAWEEMAWLRLALRIDPACEPVAMRLMALADAAGKS